LRQSQQNITGSFDIPCGRPASIMKL